MIIGEVLVLLEEIIATIVAAISAYFNLQKSKEEAAE